LEGIINKVLVTGASGLIGSDLIAAIKTTHNVLTFSRRFVPGHEGVQADIGDTVALDTAMKGVHTVVHLAAVLPDSDDDQLLMAVNVAGTYNLFEAARKHGVKRVVLASTGAISGGYMQDPQIKRIVAGEKDEKTDNGFTISELDPPRPMGMYAATKLWGEAVGRYHSEANDMSVICVRLGRVIADDSPEDDLRKSIHLSRRDAVQALVKSIEADPTLKFASFYVSSDNSNRWRDNESAKRDIGYVPLD
jgi:nucleoside-diphosphate-sugar epimerase